MDKKTLKRKGLKNRERLFCFYFVDSLNAERSAQKAGYKNPDVSGQRLLLREEIIAYIKEVLSLRKELYSALSYCGYQKLAFSSVSDAVSLLFMESPDKEALENMDLFMVQEIKKPRDGALEIKFFDRVKALEKLSEQNVDDNGNMGLMDALNLGAQRLVEDNDEL